MNNPIMLQITSNIQYNPTIIAKKAIMQSLLLVCFNEPNSKENITKPATIFPANH